MANNEEVKAKTSIDYSSAMDYHRKEHFPMKEVKKRHSFFKQFERRKRHRSDRSLSDTKKEVTKDNNKERTAVETSVSSNSCDLKSLNNQRSDPASDASVEGKDSQLMGTWTCEMCTLENPRNRQRCQVCTARKPIMALAPVSTSPVCSLPRSEHTTRGKNSSRQVVTSTNDTPVNSLKTPKTSKKADISQHIDNCVSYQTPKSAARAKIELSKNARNHPVSSTTDSNENKGDLYKARSENVSVNVQLSTTDDKENKSSERNQCKENVHRDKHEKATENTQPAPTNHVVETSGTDCLANRNYQDLQFTLTRVLDQLDKMTKLIQTQKEEMLSLREQNEEILRSHRDILNQNREMRSSLIALEAGICAQRSHLATESSINNDAPSNVSPEVRPARDFTMPKSGVHLEELEATSSATECSYNPNAEKPNDSQNAVDMASSSPENKGDSNLAFLSANEDDLQCDDKPEQSSTQELEIKHTSQRHNEVVKDGQKLRLTPLSPAASTQTIDPDESPQMRAPLKAAGPKKTLSDRTNQSVIHPATKTWMTNKHSRQFLSEMENEVRKEQPSTWLTTRSKVTSTAPFLDVSGQRQDDFLSESPQPKYAYKETVRCHKDRNGLPCHDCDECRKWYLTLKKTGHEFSQDPVAFSRHRSRFRPPETPEDFWEMSFVDERKARQLREADEQGK